MRFDTGDRELLLRTPGIGPVVIERLEALGVHSLQQLRALGVERLIAIACDEAVRHGLVTRRRALLRALELTGAQRRTFNAGLP